MLQKRLRGSWDVFLTPAYPIEIVRKFNLIHGHEWTGMYNTTKYSCWICMNQLNIDKTICYFPILDHLLINIFDQNQKKQSQFDNLISNYGHISQMNQWVPLCFQNLLIIFADTYMPIIVLLGLIKYAPALTAYTSLL
jgi:hypothetical protein